MYLNTCICMYLYCEHIYLHKYMYIYFIMNYNNVSWLKQLLLAISQEHHRASFLYCTKCYSDDNQ